ncbi:hypothetical protein [Deinococcus peraridilitoris]|nr:hypothetical protein [Deinococcus peraridilitoris]
MTPTEPPLEPWAEALSEAQREQLQWLRLQKCIVTTTEAAEEPLAGLPAGLLIEVHVDHHIVIKERGSNVPELFRQVYEAAKLFLSFPDPQ